MNDNSLLQEIEEDLSRKRLEALWKQYGHYILGAAAVIVLGTAAITGWKSYTIAHTTRSTTELIELMKDRKTAGPALFDDIEVYAAEHEGAYKVLARLQAAALAADTGDKAKALEIYGSIATDPETEAFFRQLGDLLFVQASLDDGDPLALEERLRPLMKDECAWRFAAVEYAGYLALRAGDKTKALKLFTDLKSMDGAPTDFIQRATDIERWLSEQG